MVMDSEEDWTNYRDDNTAATQAVSVTAETQDVSDIAATQAVSDTAATQDVSDTAATQGVSDTAGAGTSFKLQVRDVSHVLIDTAKYSPPDNAVKSTLGPSLQQAQTQWAN